MMGRTVEEQQKNSTFIPGVIDRKVGRQQKNQHMKSMRLSYWIASFLRDKMAIDKKRVISTIVEAASNYEKFLNNRNFLIVYKSEKTNEYVEVVFRSWHFLHLTGLKTKLTAIQFYEACIDNKLSEKDLILENNGKVRQKIQVLPYLHDLLYHNCMIGNFINSGIMIQADYFVGDTKLILSVGFRRELDRDVPVTLYSGDIRKLTNPTHRVLAIFVRRYPDTVYKDTTYVAKNVDLAELELPEEVVLSSAVDGNNNSDN